MARKTIDRLMEETGISVRQLSDRCKLDEKRVGAIVDGRWLPSPQERAQVAEAFGVQVDDIDWGHSVNPRNVRYHRFGLPEDFAK